MGQYNPKNPPEQLKVVDIIAAADNLGSFAKSCRFAVTITPTINQTGGDRVTLIDNTDFIHMCEAVEFPGRGFDVTQIRYYGPSQVVPNNTMYNTANLQFLCRNNSPERQFFDDWMEVINPTSTFNFEYPDNYYASINIYQFADYGSPGDLTGVGGTFDFFQNAQRMTDRTIKPIATYGWRLNKAWPTLVNPQQVTWADQDILRLQVTFAYRYWDRPDYKQG
jgi:hypothetical protein